MPRTLTEQDVERTLLDAASWYGFLAHHVRPARTERGWRTPLTGDVGFPDLVLALDARVFAFELKSERGRYGPGQVDWAVALGAEAGGAVLDYMLVRPSQLDAAIAKLERAASARRA